MLPERARPVPIGNRSCDALGAALPGEAVRQAEPLEQLEREPQRQSHHAEEIPADSLHQRGALALDRVGARLVERLARGHIRRDLLARERPERDVGHVERVLDPPVLCHRHGGHHLVLAPLKPFEHRDRFLGRRGLSEDVPPQHHRRVRRQHHRAGLARRHRGRLLARQPGDVALRQLGRGARLVHLGHDDAEREVQHFEQLATPRAAAREDDGIHRSRISVTGPLFTSSTSIIAPNSPVSTRVPLAAPRSLSSATNRSYSGIATSGGAASTKLGRRPFCTSPYSVNCETTSTAPPTSASARFIFPSASPNTRRPSTLSAIQARLSSVSAEANPASTTNPAPICPVPRPATRTTARETRWSTTLTGPPHPVARSTLDVAPRTHTRSCNVQPATCNASLYCHALREIARLVDIAPPPHRDVIRE